MLCRIQRAADKETGIRRNNRRYTYVFHCQRFEDGNSLLCGCLLRQRVTGFCPAVDVISGEVISENFGEVFCNAAVLYRGTPSAVPVSGSRDSGVLEVLRENNCYFPVCYQILGMQIAVAGRKVSFAFNRENLGAVLAEEIKHSFLIIRNAADRPSLHENGDRNAALLCLCERFGKRDTRKLVHRKKD